MTKKKIRTPFDGLVPGDLVDGKEILVNEYDFAKYQGYCRSYIRTGCTKMRNGEFYPYELVLKPKDGGAENVANAGPFDYVKEKAIARWMIHDRIEIAVGRMKPNTGRTKK